jgi:hypothetical protein
MSADNYNFIRKHPEGGYVVTECSASADEAEPISPTDKRFVTFTEAVQYALDDYTEYGVFIEYGIHKV